MSELAKKHCIPCSGGVPPLTGAQIAELKPQLSEDWSVVEGHHLERSWVFDDFEQALAFTNKVGELAEEEGHHPDIFLAWGKVQLTVFTHKIDGLSEADFILAAKVDEL
ncbi:MAG: 4a-hydroxytetrahydrobiopterin dehydratase [Proteobacteria bacterium]|nr:MAG: 4a-hydroxytetrahydrobiopterin dehydratase [Pseudomonadota bacterium]